MEKNRLWFLALVFAFFVVIAFAGTPSAACTPGVKNGLCCIDGTQNGDCGQTSNYTGYYCIGPEFTFKATKCGCPAGYIKDPSDATGANCKLAKCVDGTALGTCSTSKPLYCTSSGQLENDSTICTCPAGMIPFGTGCKKATCIESPGVCNANQTCDAASATCKLKNGCQYNNPACASGKTCNTRTGQCEVRPTGCEYGTETCTQGKECKNNACVAIRNQSANTGDQDSQPGSGLDNSDDAGAADSSQSPAKTACCCLPGLGFILLFGFVYKQKKPSLPGGLQTA
ncbi:hypothetical protein FJZ26_03325 [Candidatus Parvarchaeota archaeon]|nr:hypothetical protein [Candidatus Parvarchaeota archaeon]